MLRPALAAAILVLCAAFAGAQVPPAPTPHPAEGCTSQNCFTHAQTMFLRQLKLDAGGRQTSETLVRYELTPVQRQIAEELARQLVGIYLALRTR